MRGGRPAAALVAVALATPVPAVGQTFQITVAGIPIGSISLQATERGREYSAAGSAAASRALQVVAGLAFEGRASGAIDAAGRPRPVVFTSRARGPRETRETRVEWRGANPTSISIDPPPRRPPPEPALLAGSIDPISTALHVFRRPPEQICNRRFDVFDGSRVQRLSVGPITTDEVGLRCTGNLVERRADPAEQAAERVHAFWLRFDAVDGGEQRLVRVEFPTRYGRAVVARR